MRFVLSSSYDNDPWTTLDSLAILLHSQGHERANKVVDKEEGDHGNGHDMMIEKTILVERYIVESERYRVKSWHRESNGRVYTIFPETTIAKTSLTRLEARNPFIRAPQNTPRLDV